MVFDFLETANPGKEAVMTNLLVLIALFWAMFVPTPATADSGKDCNPATDPLCYALKHPQKRVLKPVPCVPIRFDQTSPGPVVVEIANKRLGTRGPISDNFALKGQFCFGEHWLRNATVTICGNDGSFTWSETMVEAALARKKVIRGLDGTLKGTAWEKDHVVKK